MATISKRKNLECAGQAKRRRRFESGLFIGAKFEGCLEQSKAVSRFACHRTPNSACRQQSDLIRRQRHHAFITSLKIIGAQSQSFQLQTIGVEFYSSCSAAKFDLLKSRADAVLTSSLTL